MRQTSRLSRRITSSAILFCLMAAVVAAQDRVTVSAKVRERTGHALGAGDAGASIPPDVSIENGISEEEAVAIALWSNAALQAELARLGIARADLAEARFLRNPIFSLLFPLGPKQLEATVSWPIEQLWLRPRKVRIAQKELDRVSESLVQHGLDLTRDVRVAHVSLRLAQTSAALAAEQAALETEITAIMQARLRAGDISEREANQQRLAAEGAREAASRATRDAAMTEEKLRGLLGWSEAGRAIELTTGETNVPAIPTSEVLLKDALAARPDLRAAELAVEMAGEKAKLEKSRIFSLTAILDMNAEGRRGFEAGPGVSGDAPLLNLNQGGRKRANAELEVAMKRYSATRQRVAQEVRESVARYDAARTSSARWRSEIVPKAEEEARLAQKSYESGDSSYLALLEARRSLANLRQQAVEAEAEVARARAELEHSIGRKTVGTAR